MTSEIQELQSKFKKWEKCFVPIKYGSLRITRHPNFNGIQLLPSLTFGTGSNLLTKGLIEVMIHIYAQSRNKPEKVLDFGSGLGILALIAKRLGSGKVDAVEISETALSLIKKNASLNRLKIGIFKQIPRNQKYDLLVSNLYEPLFCKLASQFANAMNDQGKMILTGVVEGKTHRKNIDWAFNKVGFKSEWIVRPDSWPVIVVSR